MEIHYQTDVGKRRNTNQDYTAVFTNQNGYTLALLEKKKKKIYKL